MLRVAIGQIRPLKGDYAENLRRIGGVLAQVGGWEVPPRLVAFPEAVTSGYFVEGGVQELAVTAATLYRDVAAQHSLAGAPPLDVVIGFYEVFQNRLHNSALYASLGGAEPGIKHVHRKIFLPTYGMFDEERFLDRGHDVLAFDTGWGRAAVVICEDAWHSLVTTLAALDGAQVVIIPAAAPARGVAPAVLPFSRRAVGVPAERQDGTTAEIPQSVERWDRLVRAIASEHGVFVILAQLVGFEGGKGFPGASTIVGPRGDVLVRGPLFEEALVVAGLDLDEITRARAAQPLLSDLEAQWPHLLKHATAPASQREPLAFGPEDPCPRTQRPPVPASHSVATPVSPGDPLRIDPALVEQWLTAFLRDEVVHRRGFTTGVVGLSGGVDSAVTAALAAKALGPENVIGVRLPYRRSSPDSLEHAALVAVRLGIRLETIDISSAVDGYLAAADPGADPARRGNVAARVRMIALFDLAAKHRALPLGTGNKSERLLGYFTWHADDTPPVNPLGDLFKTQVVQLARHLGIPEEILAKPFTADLVEGQTDEADLGIAYERADRILHALLRGDPRGTLLAQGFTADEIELVRRRLDGTHWKRRLPTVAMVSETAVGECYLRPVDY